MAKKPKGYKVEKYTQEVFRMFSTDETVAVQLLCDNDAMKFIVDRFGLKVRTKAVGQSHFQTTVTVCPGPTFYRWIFGFGGKILLKGPDGIREQYKKMLETEMQRYDVDCTEIE